MILCNISAQLGSAKISYEQLRSAPSFEAGCIISAEGVIIWHPRVVPPKYPETVRTSTQLPERIRHKSWKLRSEGARKEGTL